MPGPAVCRLSSDPLPRSLIAGYATFCLNFLQKHIKHLDKKLITGRNTIEGEFFMKRIVGIVLFLTIGTTAFAYESWFSAGIGYGNSFEKKLEYGQTKKTSLGYLGFDTDSFQFWNNFGFFINLSFLFPIDVNVNDNNYKYNFQFNYIIGPAFKFDITGNMKLKLGLGYSSQITLGEYSHEFMSNQNLGIGGEVGFAYILSKLININIGTILNYQFANNEKKEALNNETHEWSRDYSMFTARPYIRIGFMFKPQKK
jgi:opacity protein-like surface antigen